MRQERIFQLLLLCMIPAASFAVKINEERNKVIYLPKGESVRLGCPFSSDPEDNTPDNDWDIEWNQVKPGSYPQNNPLLGYHGHQIIRPGPPDLQDRVGFTSADPSQYDASMQLSDVQITDSATYECRVKKTTEASHKVTITVQERPAVPQCMIIGDMAYGSDITLRCFVTVGSPPLSYRWSKTYGYHFQDWLPPIGGMGSSPGDLHIYDLSDDDYGTYRCGVSNNVGVAYCSVDINFGGGFTNKWIMAGSILGALLLLGLIIALSVWACCCCWQKGCCGKGCYCGNDYCWDCCWTCCGSEGEDGVKDYQGTKGNEICVDADAPPSRPCSQVYSRASSMRSLLGYQSQAVQYAPGRKYAHGPAQVMMTSGPAREGSLVLGPDFPSPACSDVPDSTDPVYGVKGRDPYEAGSSSVHYVKGDNPTCSTSRTPIYTDPNSCSQGTSDPAASQWKDRNTRPYKGAVAMTRTSSKEGLLI